MRLNDAGPRTCEGLARCLDGIGVDAGAYHLFGAHVDNAYVLDRRPSGLTVFYSERGGEFDIALHRDEADACMDLFARVTKDEHVVTGAGRGPAGRIVVGAVPAS